MYILFFYVEWKICLENIQSTFSISISIAYLYIYVGLALRFELGLRAWNESLLALDVIIMQ